MQTDPAPAKRLLLSAFGINYGGGLVLLGALLPAMGNSLRTALLDARVKSTLTVDPSVQVTYVKRSFISRLASLWRLAGAAKRGDVIFCFNSLPPLRKARARVINYVHAPHFIGAHRGVRYKRLTAVRIVIERLWFRLGVRNCDELWVQTPSMAAALSAAYPSAQVKTVPFVDDELFALLGEQPAPPADAAGDGAEYTFFYAADSVGHKNHAVLLGAWRELARMGFVPRLLLTLDTGELREIARAPTPNVIALGRLSRAEVLERTRSCSALIFPSVTETLGIPLLEAQALGVPVLAGERDFVRDVCTPRETFDPTSARSIADAVRRFMRQPAPRGRMGSAKDVVARLLS